MIALSRGRPPPIKRTRYGGSAFEVPRHRLTSSSSLAGCHPCELADQRERQLGIRSDQASSRSSGMTMSVTGSSAIAVAE